MSGSMAPSPPVTDGRLGLCLRLGLVIAIGLIWTHGPTHGLAGTERPGKGVRCPRCGLRGGKRPDGKYSCLNRHVFINEEPVATPADAAQPEATPASAAQPEATPASAAQPEATPADAAQPEATPADAAKREG